MIQLWVHQAMSLSVMQSVVLLVLSLGAGVGMMVLASNRSDEEIHGMIESAILAIRRGWLVVWIAILKVRG